MKKATENIFDLCGADTHRGKVILPDLPLTLTNCDRL